MASTSVSTKTVVVADDTAFVRDRFRAAIEQAGHKAIAVTRMASLAPGFPVHGNGARQLRHCRPTQARKNR